MTRDTLPQRRQCDRFEFEAGGITYTAQCGYYDDGRIGEIFVQSGKTGTHLSVATSEVAIAVSFALQFGCPPEAMRTAMPRTAAGEPEGAMGTLLDMIVREGESA